MKYQYLAIAATFGLSLPSTASAEELLLECYYHVENLNRDGTTHHHDSQRTYIYLPNFPSAAGAYEYFQLAYGDVYPVSWRSRDKFEITDNRITLRKERETDPNDQSRSRVDEFIDRRDGKYTKNVIITDVDGRFGSLSEGSCEKTSFQKSNLPRPGAPTVRKF